MLLTVIGVTQHGFNGDIVERSAQRWFPIPMQPVVQAHRAPISDRGTSWLLLLGRLAPGATVEQARAILRRASGK